MKTKKSAKKRTFAEFVLNNKAMFILILMVAVIGVLSEGLFFSKRNLLNVIRQVCSSIILGCGFTVTMASGGMDLSIGNMVSLIGVIAAKISLNQGVPLPCVLLISMLVGCAAGACNGLLVNCLNLPAFIVTIGTMSVFMGITGIVSNNQSITGIPETFRLIGQGYVLGIPVPIYIMIVMVIITWILINKTEFGRYCLARGGNAAAARACGINIKRISILAYIWLGFCASISAIIITGRANSGQTGAGDGMQMDIIAAVVIGGTSMQGGIAKIVGTVIGCFMIGVINNGLNLLGVDYNYQTIVKGLIIIIAIILDTYGAQIINASKKRKE